MARLISVISNRPGSAFKSVEDLNGSYVTEYGKASIGHTKNIVRFLARCGALVPDTLSVVPELIGATSGEEMTEAGRFWFIRRLYATTAQFREIVNYLYSEELTWDSLIEKVLSVHKMNRWGKDQLVRWCDVLMLSTNLLGRAALHPWIDSYAANSIHVRHLAASLTVIRERYGGLHNQIQLANFEDEMRTIVFSGASSKRLISSVTQRLADTGVLSISRGKQEHVYVTILRADLPEPDRSLGAFLGEP